MNILESNEVSFVEIADPRSGRCNSWMCVLLRRCFFDFFFNLLISNLFFVFYFFYLMRLVWCGRVIYEVSRFFASFS